MFFRFASKRELFLVVSLATAVWALTAVTGSAQTVPAPQSVNENATGSSATSADNETAQRVNPSIGSSNAAAALAQSQVDAATTSTQVSGGSQSSATSATGNAEADLFVFDQNLNVTDGSSVRDNSAGSVVALSDNALSNVSGVAVLNQAAGVANQQGSIVRVITGAGHLAMANSLNVENQQSLDVAGTIAGNGANGYTASISGNALQNVSGVAAINQAAGVANQQINVVLWSGAPSAVGSAAMVH